MKLQIAIAGVMLAGVGTASAFAPAPKLETIPEVLGRTAGKPQRCVAVEAGRLFSTANSNPQVLLYDDGKTIWVSRLNADCSFDGGQTVVPDETASYYCNGDFVRGGSRVTLNPVGGRCVIGNFTPYRSRKNR